MARDDNSQSGERLAVAAALIQKAQSSSFPAEQEALALKAYAALAAYLNELEMANPRRGARRERRLLRDRRTRDASPDAGPSRADQAGLGSPLEVKGAYRNDGRTRQSLGRLIDRIM